ncbi:ABC transporter substrate-binding protein [Egicoccus sp. AB-alg6-2]|uniref:RsiG family protein n=1 Tax=Egicoccus sp. AB-alg6-2 TaxID=3242692 RepID=UPI00359EB8F8
MDSHGEMAAMAGHELDRILADDFLEGLETWSTDEVRTARATCEAEEEAVSYARRITQGRLDILRDELERREAGDREATDVLERLAAVLAADRPTSGPAQARSTRLRVPEGADAYASQVDRVVDDGFLADLQQRPTADLAAAVDGLAAHEQRLSVARRGLFARIDRLRDELARRYKDGSAAVTDLFGDA